MRPASSWLAGPGYFRKPQIGYQAPQNGYDSWVWRVLDKCHNTRNLGEYEGLLDVDERLVADLITATQAVADALVR